MLGREHFRESFKKIHRQLLVLKKYLKVLLRRVCLRAKCDIQGRRFRISSAALLRQVRLCFAGAGREILNSNPAESLDEHPFILYYLRLGSTVFPLSLVLQGRIVANHVLVFSICALSKLIVWFVCKAFLHYTPLWRFYVTFFCTFLGLFHVNYIEINK